MIALGIVVVLLVAGLIVAQKVGPKMLLGYLQERVAKETRGRYSLQMDSLDFDLWSMNVHLGKLELKRDSSVNAYSGIPLLDKFDVEAHYTALDVNYFNLFRFVLFNVIQVEDLKLKDLAFVLRKNRSYDPDSPAAEADLQQVDSIHLDTILADTDAARELRESGSVFFPTLIVDDLLVSNASLALYDGLKPYPIQSLEGLELHLVDVHSSQDAPFSAEDLSVSVRHASTLVSKNTARLEVSGLHLTPDTFHMDTLHFGHIVNPYRINRIKGFRASWLDIVAHDLNLTGIDYERLIADTALIIDKVSLGQLYLTLFKDKSEPVINPAYKPLPAEQIRSIPLDIEIDTVEVLSADLHVEMQAAKATRPGSIDLNDLYLLVTHVTNLPDALERNQTMEVFVEGFINRVCPVMVDFRFDLTSPESAYQAHAEVGPVDITAINPFMASQFFIDFKSGYVEEMSFYYDGNNKVNVGEMDLQYRDLRVERAKNFKKYMEKHPHTGFFAGIGNMLAPRNRSKDQKHYKTAVIYYEKEFNRDVIHGLIQSMLSGVVSSVGLATKNLEKRQKQAEELDSEDIQESAEKAKRKARRAEKKKGKEHVRESRHQRKNEAEGN